MAYDVCMLNPDDQMAIQEAMRRMSGQPASGAGFSGGMPMANSMMPTSRMSSQGQTPMGRSMAPMQPNLDKQTKALQTSAPDQTTMVLKSLIRFLDRSSPKPEEGM